MTGTIARRWRVRGPELAAGPLVVAGAVMMWLVRGTLWQTWAPLMFFDESFESWMARAEILATGGVVASAGLVCATSFRADASAGTRWLWRAAMALVFVAGVSMFVAGLVSTRMLTEWAGFGGVQVFASELAPIGRVAAPVALIALGGGGLLLTVAMLLRGHGAYPLELSRANQVIVWACVGATVGGCVLQLWSVVELRELIGRGGGQPDPAESASAILWQGRGVWLLGAAMAAWSALGLLLQWLDAIVAAGDVAADEGLRD